MYLRLITLMLLVTACGPVKVDDTSGGADDTDSGGGDDSGGGEETGQTPKVGVTINEFQASNASTLQDVDGAWPDWIELYNPDATDVDTTGFTITDDLTEPGKHTLGALTVPAGGFLLLWADGDVDQGDDHIGFSLDADGGQIALYDEQGRALTRLEYEPQATDWSAARVPDGASTWEATQTPTPGEANQASE